MTDLVTIVTSTWHRPQTLKRACASVADQTYPAVQHVVVIDGRDDATVKVLRDLGYSARGDAPKRLVELGRNWSSYSGDGGYGATARLVGAWLGSGEYIAYLDDDVEYDRNHIEVLHSLFDENTEFVCGQWHGGCASEPPGVGRTDTSGIMHRALCLKVAGGFQPDGYESDGHTIERFLAAGLRWKHNPIPTFMHPTGQHFGAPLP